MPGSGTLLEPGRYKKSNFVPSLSFEVGEGWTAEQAAVGFFDIQDDPGSLDVVAVQFANTAADSEFSLIDAMANNAFLEVSEPEQVTIGGSAFQQVVIDTVDPVDADPPIFRPVFNIAAGPLSIASGRRLQVSLMDTPDGVLAILVGGSIAEWEATLEAATPVVESIEFD